MKMALRNGGLNTTDITYVNAHGTSTPQGDIAETQAIKSVFGDQARTLAVSSTKGATGHMLGAAGAVETIVCVKAIQTDTIPPTINYEVPDPAILFDVVGNKARDARVTAVMSNSFGFGGQNASLILTREPV
jgi:3-oxoacyl-[acyl-carrier-protein] synthase II